MATATQTSVGGFPADEVVRRARDEQDLERAVTAYRFWYPTVSMEGLFHGNRELGIQDNQAIPILAAAPHHLGFTLNSDTPYGGATLDLSAGPMVIEIPPGPFIALIDDHHQRWVLDMGLPGPDGGKGGKYLVLPPEYEGKPPSGYVIGRASTFKVLLAIRALPLDGNVKRALDELRKIKVYPLASAANPKLIAFVDVTKLPSDLSPLRWEDNIQYWEVLHRIIDAEPVLEEFRPMYGLLAAIGIVKGKPFSPDARMRGILERAAKTGHDEMMVSSFASSRPDRIVWPDRKWEWVGLVSDNGDFETPSGLDLEARDRWFAQAIVGSPAMFRREVGFGSLYWLGVRDQDGAYLDGEKSYTLEVPLPVPVKLFWSVTVYDAATRSEVRTDQDRAALRSLFELKELGNQSSVVLHFGPKAPAGREQAWIKTLPGRGWFAYFRLYGPEKRAFDGGWRPGDFVATR